jgi:hypothetical protein
MIFHIIIRSERSNLKVRPVTAIESLRAHVEKIDGRSRRARSVLPFGIAELDSRLPGGGVGAGRATRGRTCTLIRSSQ